MTDKVHSRRTYNPFSPLRTLMSERRREWIDKGDEAIRRFYATGDKAMAQEIGLSPKPEELAA